MAEGRRHYGGFRSHSRSHHSTLFLSILFKSFTLKLGIMRVMNSKAQGRVRIVSHPSFCSGSSSLHYNALLKYRSVCFTFTWPTSRSKSLKHQQCSLRNYYHMSNPHPQTSPRIGNQCNCIPHSVTWDGHYLHEDFNAPKQLNATMIIWWSVPLPSG